VAVSLEERKNIAAEQVSEPQVVLVRQTALERKRGTNWRTVRPGASRGLSLWERLAIEGRIIAISGMLQELEHRIRCMYQEGRS
jgi:hypothetical protein